LDVVERAEAISSLVMGKRSRALSGGGVIWENFWDFRWVVVEESGVEGLGLGRVI
jgi:hypothetical protein